MGSILKLASYLFHPIWMPFAGTLIYFLVTPRFFPLEVIKGKLMAVAIMTLFIPIVFHFLLKTLGQVSSIFLSETRERRWPLIFFIFIDLIVLNYIFNGVDYMELHYFFLGILLSAILGLLAVLFGFKISLHMMGLGGITMFIILLSIFFNLNLIYTISFFLAVIGLTATSRLHFGAHTNAEMALGLIIGILPQALMLHFWL